jgi:hypothetical protein
MAFIYEVVGAEKMRVYYILFENAFKLKVKYLFHTLSTVSLCMEELAISLCLLGKSLKISKSILSQSFSESSNQTMLLLETRSPSLEIMPSERVIEYMLTVQKGPPNRHPLDNIIMRDKQNDFKR